MSEQSVRQAVRAKAALRKETPVRNWQSTAMAPCSLASLAHGSANAHSSCRVKGFRVRTRRTPSHHRDHAEQAGRVAQDIPVNHSRPPSHPVLQPTFDDVRCRRRSLAPLTTVIA